jgi:hypothetical protein
MSGYHVSQTCLHKLSPESQTLFVAQNFTVTVATVIGGVIIPFWQDAHHSVARALSAALFLT